MTPAGWQLATRIQALLRRDIGRTDRDLVLLLGADPLELRTACGMLYRRRKVDRIRDYVVAVPGSERRRAA